MQLKLVYEQICVGKEYSKYPPNIKVWKWCIRKCNKNCLLYKKHNSFLNLVFNLIKPCQISDYTISFLLFVDMINTVIPNEPNTAWKVSKYRVISVLYFPAFGLNILSKCGKIRTRHYSVFGHLSRRDTYGTV